MLSSRSNSQSCLFKIFLLIRSPTYFSHVQYPWNLRNKLKIASIFAVMTNFHEKQFVWFFRIFMILPATSCFYRFFNELFFTSEKSGQERHKLNLKWPVDDDAAELRKGFIRTQLSSSFSRRMWNAQHVTLKLTRIVGIIAIIKGLWCLVVFFRLFRAVHYKNWIFFGLMSLWRTANTWKIIKLNEAWWDSQVIPPVVFVVLVMIKLLSLSTTRQSIIRRHKTVS